MSRMATAFANTLSPDPLSEEDLRNAFEAALARVHPSVGPSSRAQTPIVVRPPTATLASDVAEKRALTDAARVLARLWNIAPRLVR